MEQDPDGLEKQNISRKDFDVKFDLDKKTAKVKGSASDPRRRRSSRISVVQKQRLESTRLSRGESVVSVKRKSRLKSDESTASVSNNIVNADSITELNGHGSEIIKHSKIKRKKSSGSSIKSQRRRSLKQRRNHGKPDAFGESETEFTEPDVSMKESEVLDTSSLPQNMRTDSVSTTVSNSMSMSVVPDVIFPEGETGPSQKESRTLSTNSLGLSTVTKNKLLEMKGSTNSLDQSEKSSKKQVHVTTSFTPAHYPSIQSVDSITGGMEIEEDGVNQAEDDHGFEKVKGIYNQIMEQLKEDEAQGNICLDSIHEEFTSLWEGIAASHENEKKLIKYDATLSIKLSTTMAKTRFLIKLAEDDPVLARKLALKLERIWAIADEGEEIESTNQAKIDQLKQDIFDLNRNINAASRVEGQETVKELQKIKHELEKKRDTANVETSKFRSTLNILFAQRQELFERRTNLEEKSSLLDKEFQVQHDAIERETERKGRLANEMQEVRTKLATKRSELWELEKSLQYAANKIIDTDRSLMEQQAANEAAMRDRDLSYGRLEKLRADFDSQQKVVERLTTSALRQSQELKLKEGEVNFLKLELSRTMRQRSTNMKRVVTLQQAMTTLEIERDSLKHKINALERELEHAQRKLDDNKRKVERLDKERQFVNRNLKRAEAVTSEHAQQYKVHEAVLNNIEQAVDAYSAEIRHQKTMITRLENERDFYSLESTKLGQQVAFQIAELKKLDFAIFQYKKKVGALETLLKKTQQTYDLAVYDKAMFERTLSDTLAEILENNTKIKHLNNQISALKYQLNEKDEIIHQEALRMDRILKETEFFSKESKRIQRMVQDIQRNTEALEMERSVLGCAIAELEGELSKENYYAKSAQSRGDVFQRQLMKKEMELRCVWDKWRELDSTIRIGAYHYKSLISQIRSYRADVLTCRKEQDLQKKCGNHAKLLREVTILENGIDREKYMINSLTEQMKNPINVHRWRVLEATDPVAYEMVLKINLVTKKLVDRNASLQKKSKQLTEKEAIYVEMRKGLARGPGLETPEEVLYYQHLLVAKRQQYECLKHELKAAEAQTSYYRAEVKNLNEQMKSLKDKYFEKLKAKSRGTKNCIVQAEEPKKGYDRPLKPLEDYNSNNYYNSITGEG